MLTHHPSLKLGRGYAHSYSDIAARFTDPPREDHLHLPSPQARTSPPVKKSVPTSGSNSISQRMQIVPSVPEPASPSSKQAKQPGLRVAGVHDLLIPTKGEDDAYTGSELRSSSKRVADSPTSLTLPSARSPHLRQSQERPSSQMQDCEGLIISSLAPPHPVAQNVIPNTQSSACDRVFHAGSRMASPAPLISQSQAFPRSDQISTMTLGTDGRHLMMTMDIGSELLHVPMDVQAASKVADEKRKRNATASHRFREHRKEKERENTKKFSELKQKIRELEGERNYYRDVAARNSGQVPFLPKPEQM